MNKFMLASAALMLLGAGCPAEKPGEIMSDPPPAEPDAVMLKINTGSPAAVRGQAAEKNLIMTALVKYGLDEKFMPQSIGVHAGGTITWVNESKQNIWIASDPHPVHTGYPGFDSKKPVGPGESWSFKFDKPGVFPYHNHPIVGQQGLVVITDPAE